MSRRFCTLTEEPLQGRLLGYATGHEFGHQARAFRTIEEACSAARECDILVIREFGDESVQLVREITRKNPRLDVIVLGYENSPTPMSYYEAGAAGYVGKDAYEDELLEQLRANARGESLLDPPTARRLVRRVAELSRMVDEREFEPDRCANLTGRQREICGILANGATNAEIGERLRIAGGTVKSHLHNIYRRLDVDSRHMAAALWRIWNEDREAAR